MSDNLRVTSPIPKNENNIKQIRPLTQTPNLNTVEQIKPNLKQGQEAEANKNAFDFLLSKDSVFAKFMEQLKTTPELSQSLPQLMQIAKLLAQNPKTANKAEQLLYQNLYKSINMNKNDILNNLVFQQKNQTKFNSLLFQSLRELANQTQDNNLNLRLAKFLKAYDGYFSLPNTMQAIKYDLAQIRSQIIPPYSTNLHELENKLITTKPSNNVDLNITLLTEEILPYLKKYVGQTNDMGKTRNQIALLMHHIARLDISSKENLIEKFESLLNYCNYNMNLGNESLLALKNMFGDAINKQTHAEQNHFFEALINILAQDPNNSTKIPSAIITDTLNSLLLDNSVHMPYTHLFLPIIFGDRFMFSEIWLEKQDFDDDSSSANPAGKPRHILLEFNIENLGSFEASIEFLDKDISIDLNYPETLKTKQNEISKTIAEIFSQNGFNTEKIVLSTESAIPVKQRLLHKIQERKYAIDVTI